MYHLLSSKFNSIQINSVAGHLYLWHICVFEFSIALQSTLFSVPK